MISRRLISFPSLSVPIGSYRETSRERFFSGTEHHQKFIINAARRIGGKARGFFRIKGIDRFDQTDSSDGDQVFRIFTGTLIFFYYVGDQAEVMLD